MAESRPPPGTGPRGTAGNEGDRESTKGPTSCCGLTHTGAREPRPGQALSRQMGRVGSRPATLLGKASASSPSPGLNDWEPIHILSFSLSLSPTVMLAKLVPSPAFRPTPSRTPSATSPVSQGHPFSTEPLLLLLLRCKQEFSITG